MGRLERTTLDSVKSQWMHHFRPAVATINQSRRNLVGLQADVETFIAFYGINPIDRSALAVVEFQPARTCCLLSDDSLRARRPSLTSRPSIWQVIGRGQGRFCPTRDVGHSGRKRADCNKVKLCKGKQTKGRVIMKSEPREWELFGEDQQENSEDEEELESNLDVVKNKRDSRLSVFVISKANYNYSLILLSSTRRAVRVHGKTCTKLEHNQVNWLPRLARQLALFGHETMKE